MESRSFLTLFSTNIVQTSRLVANIVCCLAVWGVKEPVTEVGDPGTEGFTLIGIIEVALVLRMGMSQFTLPMPRHLSLTASKNVARDTTGGILIRV